MSGLRLGTTGVLVSTISYCCRIVGNQGINMTRSDDSLGPMIKLHKVVFRCKSSCSARVGSDNLYSFESWRWLFRAVQIRVHIFD